MIYYRNAIELEHKWCSPACRLMAIQVHAHLLLVWQQAQKACTVFLMYSYLLDKAEKHLEGI